MRVLEKTIEAKVVKWAHERGILVTKLQGPGNRSMPDRCFWVPGGRPVLIEFKRSGGVLTKLQGMTIARLRIAGYRVEVFHSAIECIDFIRNYDGSI